MRGEYKVPSGPTIVVEVDVVDDVIADARLVGEASPAVAEALPRLRGLSAKSSVDAYTAAMGDVEGARDTAVAVRRALAGATNWADLTFDVIRPHRLSPAMHVALDEVIAAEVADGIVNPNLRIWEWDTPCVVLGSFQSYANEIDDEGRARHGMEVIRRISGGGAMFMEPDKAITWSLAAPTSLVEGMSFEQSYAFLDEWVLEALASLGIKARYVPLNDIASDRGKIAGAAQRRLAKGAVLHHVTSSYDIDADKMLDVLRLGRASVSDKGTKSANKRVDPMCSQTWLSRDAVIARFVETFEARHRCVERDYSDAELAAAEELVRTKFGTPEWTRRVP